MHLAELTSLSWKKHILSVKLQTSIGASPMATSHLKKLLMKHSNVADWQSKRRSSNVGSIPTYYASQKAFIALRVLRYFAKDGNAFSSDIGDDGWGAEKRRREIECEEIQGLLLKYYPSQTVEDKKAKMEWLEFIFQTRSWTAVEGMRADDLKLKRESLKIALEEKHKAIEQ